MFKYAFVNFLDDISIHIIIGIVISGIISFFIPDDFFTKYINYPVRSFLPLCRDKIFKSIEV